MQNLPNEVIIPIYRHLNQQDQAQGRLLGRNFNIAISSIHYQTIYIYSARALNCLVRDIIEDPTIATRIERLIVNFPEDEALDGDDMGGDVMDIDDNSQQARTRLHRFRRINVNRNRNNLNGLLRDSQNLIALHSSVSGIITRNQSTLPLITNIELISEANDSALVHHFLSAGPCSSLNAIRSTTFSNYPMLRQSPGLRTLHLTRLDVAAMTIDFTSFELIHNQIPLLTSLRLFNLDFRGRLRFPQTFEMAPLVRHFSTNIARGALSVLQYITRKYPGLISLEYDIGASMSTNDQIIALHFAGWVPFFVTLGAGLQSLTYGAHFRHFQFVQAMDATPCRINYLSLDRVTHNLLHTLTLSRQAIFIETLVLKEAECQAFAWLSFFINLRKLKLVNCRHSAFIEQIQLSHILINVPGTLESLSLENLTIVTGNVDIISPNITALSFDHIWISQQMSERIPLCFPSISRLKVKFSPVERGYIDLSNFNLAEFHFVGNITFQRNSKNLQVYTVPTGETRFYYVDNYQTKVISKDVTSLIDPSYKIPVRSVRLTMEEVISQVYDTEFVLFCNSLEKIIFV